MRQPAFTLPRAAWIRIRRSRRAQLAIGLAVALMASAVTVASAVADRGHRTDAAKRVQAAERAKRAGRETSRAPETDLFAIEPPTTLAASTTSSTTASTTTTTTSPPGAAAAAPPPPVQPSTAPAPGGAAPPPAGAGYYVSTDGDDNAAGAVDAPWRSLGAAVSRLAPGDTLYVRGGRYELARDEQLNIEGKNGDPGRWIRIASYPGERPVVQLNSYWQGILVKGSSYVDIRGLELVGTGSADQRPTAGVEIRESHHVTIAGVYAHDLGGCGICSIDANHVRIEGNEVAATSKWNSYQTSAISFFTSMNIGGGNNADGFSMYIRNNRVHHAQNITPPASGEKVTDGNCIIVDYNQDHGYRGATLIQNNLCYENGGKGINVTHSDNVAAVNNTLVGNLRTAEIPGGELTATHASNVVFRNNVVAPSRAGAGNSLSDGATAAFDHNVYVGAAPSVVGEGDLVVSRAIGADFRPFADSVLIDGSNPQLAPPTDLTGAARMGVADIGAFELL